ncbi:MAG: hypothetical protein ACTSV5_09250 [Promethearchaeota archaeon]
MDSIAGMGFGTALAPLLLLLGYSPLQIVPTLLISETLTGAIDAFFDHEFQNVHFSFHSINDATKLSILIALFGCLAIGISIFFWILCHMFFRITNQNVCCDIGVIHGYFSNLPHFH